MCTPKFSRTLYNRRSKRATSVETYKQNLEITKLQQQLRQYQLRTDMLERNMKNARLGHLNRYVSLQNNPNYLPIHHSALNKDRHKSLPLSIQPYQRLPHVHQRQYHQIHNQLRYPNSFFRTEDEVVPQTASSYKLPKTTYQTKTHSAKSDASIKNDAPHYIKTASINTKPILKVHRKLLKEFGEPSKLFSFHEVKTHNLDEPDRNIAQKNQRQALKVVSANLKINNTSASKPKDLLRKQSVNRNMLSLKQHKNVHPKEHSKHDKKKSVTVKLYKQIPTNYRTISPAHKPTNNKQQNVSKFRKHNNSHSILKLRHNINLDRTKFLESEEKSNGEVKDEVDQDFYYSRVKEIFGVNKEYENNPTENYPRKNEDKSEVVGIKTSRNDSSLSATINADQDENNSKISDFFHSNPFFNFNKHFGNYIKDLFEDFSSNKTNNTSRKRRAIELEPSEKLGQFYIVKSGEGDGVDDYPEEIIKELEEVDEDYNNVDNGADEFYEQYNHKYNGEENKEVVGSVKQVDLDEILLQPLNFKHMVPFKPLFYFINTPLRVLNHFHKLRERIFPVLKSVPLVFKNSQKYIFDFGKKMRTNALHIASDFIGDFDDFNTANDGIKKAIVPSRRYRRSVHENNVHHRKNNNKGSIKKYLPRRKRTLLKVVDDTEIEDFLHEKLSVFGNRDTKIQVKQSNAKSTSKYSTQGKTEKHNKSQKYFEPDKQDLVGQTPPKKKKIVLEKVNPKIIIDNNGIPFFEINGMRQPVINKNWLPLFENLDVSKFPGLNQIQESSVLDRFKARSGNPIVSSYHVDEHNVHEVIEEILEKAKDFDDEVVGQSESYDTKMYTKILKDKINQTLLHIQYLITADFDKDFDLFENILKLQMEKHELTDNWKLMLMNNKGGNLKDRLRILSGIQKLQIFKEEIVKEIIEQLNNDEYHNKKRLIKLLVRIQKLQHILLKIVEDFGQKIHMRTKLFDHDIDIQKEIGLIDHLENVKFLNAKGREEVRQLIKDERNSQLEASMKLLEDLRSIEEKEDDEEYRIKISSLGKVLWEMKNIEKLQSDTYAELNENISHGRSVRRDLKILFDLQNQHENLEMKQKILLCDICGKPEKNVQKSLRTEVKSGSEKEKVGAVRKLFLFLPENRTPQPKTSIKSLLEKLRSRNTK